MKKITLVLTLAFGLFLFAGCSKSNSTENVDEGNNAPKETNIEENVVKNVEENEDNGGDIMALYKNGGKLTCDMEAVEEELGQVFAKLYVDGDKSFIETSFQLEGEDMNLYALTRDGKTYSRGDMYGEGFGFVVAAESTVEQQLSDYDAERENIKMDCKSGVEGANFDVPSDIEFSDLSSLYQ